jgi:NTE family protein
MPADPFTRLPWKYGDSHPPLDTRKIVDVRTIKMTRDTAWGLKHTSKFDCSLAHFAKLREEGQAVAQQWLADWRTLGKDFVRYPNDARYPETT